MTDSHAEERSACLWDLRVPLWLYYAGVGGAFISGFLFGAWFYGN